MCIYIYKSITTDIWSRTKNVKTQIHRTSLIFLPGSTCFKHSKKTCLTNHQEMSIWMILNASNRRASNS